MGGKSNNRGTFFGQVWLLLALGMPAWASWDLSVSASARNYPLSVYGSSEVGKFQHLWGAGLWKAGLRPYVEVGSIGVYSSVLGGVEFYPISFLSIRGFWDRSWNERDYRDFDCVTYACRGSFTRRRGEASLALAASSMFLLAHAGLEISRSESVVGSTRPFVEINSGLIVDSPNPDIRHASGILGYGRNQPFRPLVALQYAENELGLSRFSLFGVQYKTESWSLLLLGGVYESTWLAKSGVGVVRLTWSPYPKATVF